MYLSHGSILIWYDGNMHHKLYIQKQKPKCYHDV